MARPPAPGAADGADHALLSTLARDLLAALLGSLLALVLLLYLHDEWQPDWALLCGGLGGILARRVVRPSYTSFPAYLRVPLSVGAVALGTVLTSWATLVREPWAYWILVWREAITLPVVAAIMGVGLASVIYTHARLQREVEGRRLLEEDLKVARGIQRSLLEGRMPTLRWLDAHAVNIASREVGGDYYELIEEREGGVCLAVGDVSGKGVPAALLMSSLQSSFLAAHSVHDDLADVCAHVNSFLVARTSPERYATFFVASVDVDGSLRYVNAGHNPPILLAGGDGFERLSGGGLPLGLFPDVGYEVQERRLEADDVLLVYTDGVTEAGQGGPGEFGESRLAEVASGHATEPAARITEAILDAIRDHTRGTPEQGDDITLMVLRRRPST